MSEHGVVTERVINGGGIPTSNPVLNQVYANVLGRPVLVPSSKVTSLGSAIFAALAAGAFTSIEEAQSKLCPPSTVFTPQPEATSIYDKLYNCYRRLYFDLGKESPTTVFGEVLPALLRIAAIQRPTEAQASASA
jgi:L-ribulokinase